MTLNTRSSTRVRAIENNLLKVRLLKIYILKVRAIEKNLTWPQPHAWLELLDTCTWDIT
jgi:hypothetical protein